MYRIALVLILGFALTGCSDLSSSVTGLVKMDGEPLKIAEDQRGTVMFRPVKGGATATAIIDDDGTYELSTGSKRAIAPGDYLVAVRVVQIVPAAAGETTPSGTPITPALYADPLKSGLQYTVASGSNNIDIDLDSDAGPIIPVEPEALEDSESDVEEDGEADDESEAASDESAESEESDQAESPEEPADEAASGQEDTDVTELPEEASDAAEQEASPEVTEDAPVKTEEKADDAS